MANGYVPHFMRPNPLMFPGIPPAQPHLPHRAPPRPGQQDPSHPKDHFDPPNYAHLPPGVNPNPAHNAYPAPNAGGQFYQSSLNDHANLFSSPQHDNAQCRFPNAFPADGGPNIIQRFWIALFGPPIRLSLSIFGALRSTYTFCATPELREALPTFLSDYGMMGMLIFDHSWALLIGLLVVVAFCVATWFLSPKGENQTVWRSLLILSAASCYLMWAITFLAQWHPLIEPKMTKLRPHYAGGS